MSQKYLFFLTLFFLALYPTAAPAAERESDLLSRGDRLLILAPHPDDEAIGCGGIIQRAVAMKLPLKIVYLTYGENNQLAFLVYKKHPVLSKAGLVRMGEQRRKEATAAMAALGVPKENLIFLGYPDFGTLNIFIQHWNNAPPYRGLLTHSKSVPYPDAFAPQSPHKGENLLENLKTILRDFRPTKIITTLPSDVNGDHRAAYLFLTVALWDLQKTIPPPQLYGFLVHTAAWPKPRGFHEDLPLNPPDNFKKPDLQWIAVPLSPQEILNKKNAISFYKSQIAYNPKYLVTFARANELFTQYPPIVLSSDPRDAEEGSSPGVQNIEANLVEENTEKSSVIRTISYTIDRNTLRIEIKEKSWESPLSFIDVFIFGYNRIIPFPHMPKIRLRIDFNKFLLVSNNGRHIYRHGVTIFKIKRKIIIHVPLPLLGEPEYILSSARTSVSEIPTEVTPWRVLLVPKNGEKN